MTSMATNISQQTTPENRYAFQLLNMHGIRMPLQQLEQQQQQQQNLSHPPYSTQDNHYHDSGSRVGSPAHTHHSDSPDASTGDSSNKSLSMRNDQLLTGLKTEHGPGPSRPTNHQVQTGWNFEEQFKQVSPTRNYSSIVSCRIFRGR